MSEAAVRLSELNEVIPEMCDHCRDRLEGLRVVNLQSGEKLGILLGPRPPELQELMETVAKRHEMSVGELVEKRSSQRYVKARADFCIMAKGMGYSFPQIGKALGRHHTTVVHLVCHRGKK